LSGLKSQKKGYRTENQMIRYIKDRGFDCYRHSISGSGNEKNDLTIHGVFGKNLSCEVKCLKDGFKTDYTWLEKCKREKPNGEVSCIIKKADRREPLLVMDFNDFLSLAKQEL